MCGDPQSGWRVESGERQAEQLGERNKNPHLVIGVQAPPPPPGCSLCGIAKPTATMDPKKNPSDSFALTSSAGAPEELQHAASTARRTCIDLSARRDDRSSCKPRRIAALIEKDFRKKFHLTSGRASLGSPRYGEVEHRNYGLRVGFLWAEQYKLVIRFRIDDHPPIVWAADGSKSVTS